MNTYFFALYREHVEKQNKTNELCNQTKLEITEKNGMENNTFSVHFYSRKEQKQHLKT